MFEKTGTARSPWVVINGNNKDLARKEAMRYVLHQVDYDQKGLTEASLTYNPNIVKVIGR